jgi:hypothetical protein
MMFGNRTIWKCSAFRCPCCVLERGEGEGRRRALPGSCVRCTLHYPGSGTLHWPGCSPARLLERGARAGTSALVCGLPVPHLLLFSDNSASYRLDKTRAIHRLAGRGGVVECGLSCVFPLRVLGGGGYACSAVLGEWGVCAHSVVHAQSTMSH